MRKLCVVASVLATGVGTALAVTMPAAAQQDPSGTTQTATTMSTTPAGRACRAHHALYLAGGRLVSWSLTQNRNRRWSGTLTVDVKRGWRHAKSQVGSTVTYTVNNARVRIGRRARPPAAGDRVLTLGTITVLPKRCSDAGFTPVVTLRRIWVAAPRGSGTTTTTTPTTTTTTAP